MTRKIIHIDMDAFYASIEQRDKPYLKGKPVIVGGTPEQRGVVAAASYEARKYGIRSAMPASRAVSLCKDLIIVPPDFEKYKIASHSLHEIFREYTDLIEPLSLDEAYLDVTENKKKIPYATDVADEIKKRIREELNLTASAGVAPNKMLAKIASDENKPDGLFVIKPHQVDDFVKTLKVGRISGVGKVTEKRMHDMGVFTCEDLQKYSKEELVKNFGKFGNDLYRYCRGIDDRPVVAEREIKSVGSETTFPEDYYDLDKIKNALRDQVGQTCRRLKKNNIKGRTITLKIKYADFTQITRSCTIDERTCDTEKITDVSFQLLEKTEAGSRKIRLIGVSVSNFSESEKDMQGELFDRK